MRCRYPSDNVGNVVMRPRELDKRPIGGGISGHVRCLCALHGSARIALLLVCIVNFPIGIERDLRTQ